MGNGYLKRNQWLNLLSSSWSSSSLLDCVWNVMAHGEKPNFVFRRNGRVHLNRRGRQFSHLLAAEVCVSAVVMLDTPCSGVVWRVLAAHSIRQFPLHFPSRASPCDVTFQLDCTTFMLGIYNDIPDTNYISSVYSVAAVLYLHFVLPVMLFRPWNMFWTITPVLSILLLLLLLLLLFIIIIIIFLFLSSSWSSSSYFSLLSFSWEIFAYPGI